MALRLYQFAISHYCEKIRWALDYKKLNYETTNLLPGQHMKTVQKLTRGAGASVPVLEHDGTVLQGSSAILDYLDRTFLDNPLTPADESVRARALAWEKRLDEEAGPAVRCYSYHHFLQRPKIVVPLLTAGTPFYNRILLSLAFSRVNEVMRKWLKINDKTAEESRKVIEGLLIELSEVYGQQPFLAGDAFSRADLTAAALFAPLFQPAAYPVPWPKPARVPKEIQAQLSLWQPQLQVLNRIYSDHRERGEKRDD
ncbi:glutathione S-transferase family protein [Marinobacter antarcticus]|uniref:Glutathione S-transferase family protein n=1 Tax=Marinobacter antarcticus TaxID=564117 RepID=A0A831VWA1_9GAMM|nr:glutathione S-transferase family protein [Marinobacter antarcticus]HEA52949.1 glutathione S-transferase family protein [Marinobacter antarcticus]